MAQGITIPDRPRLDLDPGMSESEELSKLREHFVEVVRVNRELEDRLDEIEAAQATLRDRADRLERENNTLKSAPSYIATVEDVLDEEAIVRQHGSNQEVVTDLPVELADALDPGGRVAVSDSFTIETPLDLEMDARARAMEVEAAPSTDYEDIGGLDDQIREVKETIELPLREPETFRDVGIDPPSGVLLHGEPGTGKTMLAKAVANRTDATFIKMAGSELVQKFIGEGARLVRDLFDLAEERAPAVVFVDELDAIAAKRTESKTSGDAEVQRTMMQLLSEMDGFDDRGEVRLIAATNRFDMLDRAILRPGRFDRLIEVSSPDRDARERIFEIHTRSMNVADDVDFAALAGETDPASGADIKAICTESGMFAIRDDRTEVRMEDFRDAYEKIVAAGAVARPVSSYMY